MLLLTLLLAAVPAALGSDDTTGDADSVAFYFSEQPSDTWIPIGENATLSCRISTSVECTWTWLLHTSPTDTAGSPIGGSSPSLTLEPTDTVTLNGKFVSCSADIVGTKLVSRFALIRVGYLGEDFATEPSDVTVPPGTDHVRLDCAPPPGNPAPHVIWRQDGVEVDVENAYVDPLGGLNVINVVEGNAGEYVCVARSHVTGGEVESRSASLAVSGTPLTVEESEVAYDVSFVSSRYKVTARKGDTVRVLCGFLGTPTPSLTLQSDGSALSASDTTSISVYQTWAELENVAASASLKCSGDNSAGSQTLNIALEVTGTLEVEGGREISILEGEDTTLICTDTGEGTVDYTWYKNGVELGGESANILTILSAEREDSGMYQCFGSNSDSREQSSFALTVAGLTPVPVIVSVSGEEYALVGESATLSCTGEGNPVPVVSWHRAVGNSENAISTAHVAVKRTFTEILSVLVVEALTTADDGTEYICKGSNKDLYQEDVIYTAATRLKLQVVDPVYPSISLPSTSVAESGSALTLICSVEGSPPPVIKWFRDGVEIGGENSEEYITSQGGLYTCTATNSLGTVTQDVLVQTTAKFTGGEVILLILIVLFMLTVLVTLLLIYVRKAELERRANEERARDELLLENEKRSLIRTPTGGTPAPTLRTPTPAPRTPTPGLIIENEGAVSHQDSVDRATTPSRLGTPGPAPTPVRGGTPVPTLDE